MALNSAPVASANVLSWTPSTFPMNTYAAFGIATSADGTRVFAGAQRGGYLSVDSGASWTAMSPLNDVNSSSYTAVGMSSDGAKIYYAFNNKFYYSWDYGATWNNTLINNANKNIWSISTSYNGTNILATTRDGGLYSYSKNSGQSWTTVTDSYGGGWAGAISGDGTKIVIAETNTKNVSTGSGIPRFGPIDGALSAKPLGDINTGSFNLWFGAACDEDCSVILLANVSGGLFTSSDSGATWVLGANSNYGAAFKSFAFTGVSSNPDGSRLVASVSSGTGSGTYISTDYGVNWTYQNSDIGKEGVVISRSGNVVYGLTSTSGSSSTVSRAVFPTASTTTLTTPNTTGVYGTSNTLTATINSNTATGTVDFKNNGTSIFGCSARTVTAGIATCSPNVGTYSNVTAVYGGGGSIGGSTSNSVSFEVTHATLTVTASSPTVNYGAAKPTITASYSGLVNGDASTVVTGLICDTVYTTTSPAESLPATSCSGGTASNYTITYVSGAVIINKVAPTLSLALPANALTATYGTAVVITATVNKPGAVTFKVEGNAIAGCTSVAATTTGTCNWSPSPTNSSTVLTADFVPTDSTNYTSLTGVGSRTINVGKATQSITLTAASTNFNLGLSDTLTATVTAGASGTVTFSAGGNTLCTTGSLDSAGIASCAWTPTAAGTYAVTAAYSGDSNYVTATSSSLSVAVNSVITFDVNGGVGTAPSAFTSPATSTTLPSGSTLSKSGYTFGGWSTTGSGPAVSSTYSSTTSRTLYAVWTANTYTITYNANNGSGSQTSGSYTTGATATTLPATTTFTRTGYTFGGWATSATSTTPVTSYSTSANVSFFAIWIHGTYTVTFNANGGSGTMAAQTSNATANLNGNTFTYTDREFNSWNTSADGTGTVYSNSVSYPFLANITLYAQWGNVITFSSQGATSGTPSQTSRSWSSGAINLPQVGTMVKAGYTFGGWSNGTTTYAGGASYTPTGGITLNPVWTANTYTISFNSNSATSGNVPANQSWTSGNTARTLSGNIGSPVLAKSGYTFGGWATTASSTTRVATYSSFANQTLYAIWTPISYTITYALNGGTSPLPTQASKNIYNTFSLAATPTKADFYFAGWSDGTTTYGALATYTITATSPTAITLTAQWIPIYTVSYVLNGSSSSVTGEGSYTSGTVVTLSTTPVRTGYTFNNWLDSSNVTHAAGSGFTVLQNSVLQAQWTAVLYPVTYALNGASGTLPLQSSLAMNSPFVISSTEPVRAGYTFDGWSDGTDIYSSGSTYVIGVSSVTLTAQWSAIPYSVTYDLGGGQGTLPTQADGLIGSTFTLPASSANPTWIAHTFTGWSDGAAVYAAGATYTFGASNVTLTAQFSLNGYTQVTYSLGASGAGALPNPTSALEGNTITVASGAGVTRSNYAFAGWTDGSNLYQPGDIYLVGPEAAPVTFEPSWTSGYNVAYSTGSGFGIAPIDTVGRITGATFTVASASTLSRQGFTFTGWSDGTNVVQPGSTYTVGSANITLTAQWVQNSLAGIASSALTPLASFSIVNGVGPSGSFNFGSTTVSIYGLTDTSTISGVLPSGKTVVSSTVISWLSTDGTVPDASSPIAMTITNSEIVPGTVVYAITGSTLVNLGTATSNGSITTSITSDPVIILANPVVVAPTPPSSSGGVGGSTYVEPTPTVDPDAAAAAAAAAKALAEKAATEAKLAAEAKAAADAKALADKKAAEEAELLATLKALQEKADAEALAAAKKVADELAAAQLKAEEELKASAALKLAEEQRIAAERAAAAKRITTVYSTSAAFKLNTTYTKRLKTNTKKIAAGSTVTCIGYAKSSKTLSYAEAKVVATKQAKALCSSMKKINPTLKTKSTVLPASKAPKTTVNKKWIPVSYRVETAIN